MEETMAISGNNIPPLIVNNNNIPPLIVNNNNIPPLIVNNRVQNQMVSLQPLIIKQDDGVSAASPVKTNIQPLIIQKSPVAANNNTNMRLVQTADGKKLLLTNIVKTTSKPATVSGNQMMLVPNNMMVHQPPLQSPINPVVPANAPRTLIIQSNRPNVPIQKVAPGSQQVLFRMPGTNQTCILKQSPAVTLAGPRPVAQQVTIKQEPISVQSTDVSSNSQNFSYGTILTTPTTSLAPAANPVILLNSDGKKFKVVGTPVPIRLHPKVLPKLAPKGQALLPPLQKPHQNPLPSPAIQMKSLVTKPPAYLNISIKEEQEEEAISETVYVDVDVKIKEEPIDPQTELEEALEQASQDDFLDVRIKEEPSEEYELVARDEQLQKVLGLTANTCTKSEPSETPPHDTEEDQLMVEELTQCSTTSINKTSSPNKPPKFFIRSSEGKLISISAEEADALGLDHNGRHEENQRKLILALSKGNCEKGIKRAFDKKTLQVLIPKNVDLTTFVNRKVSPEAEKAATLMKTMKYTTKSYASKLQNNSYIPTKTNTSIIGEYIEGGTTFLKIHIETEDGQRDVCNIPKTCLNTYQCPFCKKDFKTKDHIISHIRVHTGERPYPCDICGKRYRQRIDIVRHMRIHTGEKPFTCGLCNVSFNQKSNLRSHMRIHTGERPVQCKVCGKGFSRNTHLKQHMKLHTGEKPFSCKTCYRPFRFKSGLQAHERIHTGCKPYACSICGRGFTQIVGLLRHERSHAGEKAFRCQVCGKSFDNDEGLSLHMKKHTSERPYSCEICKKTFTDKAALRCHSKKYHSNILFCVICLREDFKTRIELREHLRAHERDNWEENEEGDLVPREGATFVGIDDTMEDSEESSHELEEDTNEDTNEEDGLLGTEQIQVEVELDVDNPLEDDDFEDSDNDDQVDPLADPQ